MMNIREIVLLPSEERVLNDIQKMKPIPKPDEEFAVSLVDLGLAEPWPLHRNESGEIYNYQITKDGERYLVYIKEYRDDMRSNRRRSNAALTVSIISAIISGIAVLLQRLWPLQ